MIRLAILGVGRMATHHANIVAAIPQAELVAACDIDESRVREYAEQFGIQNSYTDLDVMLDTGGFDAVLNVTPDAFHHPLSLRVLSAGYHLLCEKPLAVDVAQAEEMLAAAERAGVVHMVNFSYRSSAALQEARRLVTSGELGRIRHLDAHYYQGWLASQHNGDWRTLPSWLWRLSSAHGSKGVLGDVGVHIIDFATYPTGEDIIRLNCQMKCFEKERIDDYLMDVNDTAILSVELSGGGVGTIQTTRWAGGENNAVRLRLYGEHGALAIDLEKGFDRLETCLGKDFHKPEWSVRVCEPTPNNHERFIHAIETGENCQPDFACGLAVQRTLEACFESAANGRYVEPLVSINS